MPAVALIVTPIPVTYPAAEQHFHIGQLLFRRSENQSEEEKEMANNSHSVSGNKQAALHHHIGQKIQIVG